MTCIGSKSTASTSAAALQNSTILVQTLPLPQCQACVIVPVRNEAERLEKTLMALAHQVDQQGHPLDPTCYEVILLANNCSDRSAAIARQFAARHPNFVLHVVELTLPPEKAHIGWVRKLLMDEACRRLLWLKRDRGVIASTDGDTEVAPDWVAATLLEIAQGADAVGGRIITDRSDRSALDSYARACHLREVGYRFLVAELEAHIDPDAADPLPRHFQHYGASFAVTAEQYQRAGGLPPVRSSEDVALYQALMRIGASLRHSPRVRVTTSARSVGRAQNGLAEQLRTWATMGQAQQPFLVEPAGAVFTRLQARRELREIWERRAGAGELGLPANRLGIDCDWLAEVLFQCESFPALMEQVEQRMQVESWRQRWGLVRVEDAIAELRLRLEPLRKARSLTRSLK